MPKPKEQKIKREKPRYIEEPNYQSDIPGMGVNERLDANVSVRGLGESSGSGFVVAFVDIPTDTTTGSLDITSSDINFVPSRMRIQAQLDAGGATGDASWSDMTCDGVRCGGIFTLSNQASHSYTRIIRLFDTSSNEFGANFTSFINGGVRVNVTDADFGGGEPVRCIITAYR